jgi:hypothetical protein
MTIRDRLPGVISVAAGIVSGRHQDCQTATLRAVVTSMATSRPRGRLWPAAAARGRGRLLPERGSGPGGVC